MRINDEDLVITLTRFGLWIEWKKNPEYGVFVEAWGRSIAVSGWMGNNIISKDYCDADASRKELASVIDMLVMRDGKL
jgi:succinate dehydrogenase hydrophobic anchor subunit